MKVKTLIVAAFLCVPVGILVTAALRRQAVYQGLSASAWFARITCWHKTPALEAMQHLGKAAVPCLEEALKAPDSVTRHQAAWVLGQLGPDARAAVPALLRALNDEEDMVVSMSIEALGAIAPLTEDLAPKLVAKLGKGNESSRYACTVLWQIERERKVANLSPPFTNAYDFAMAFARSPTPYIRVRGAYRLVNMSPQDDRVKAAIQALVNDPDLSVRDRIGVFLRFPNAIPPENMHWAYQPYPP